MASFTNDDSHYISPAVKRLLQLTPLEAGSGAEEGTKVEVDKADSIISFILSEMQRQKLVRACDTARHWKYPSPLSRHKKPRDPKLRSVLEALETLGFTLTITSLSSSDTKETDQ